VENGLAIMEIPRQNQPMGRGTPPLAAILLSAWALVAQTAPPLSFEAASVKPAPDRGAGSLRGGPGTNSPGQITGVVTLKTLILWAYELKPYQLNGPSWMDSERYEVIAKVPGGSTKRQADAMLRTLLEQRFHIAVHRETREAALLDLVVGKNGPKVKDAETGQGAASDAGESDTDRALPQLQKGSDGLPELAPGARLQRSYLVMISGTDGVRIKRFARGETMQQLAEDLSMYLNRPVFDRTNLPGRYDFTLDWAMETAGGGIPRVGPPPDEIDSHAAPIGVSDSTTIFEAVQSQLGLKLEQKKGPVETLIVDHADRVPTGN